MPCTSNPKFSHKVSFVREAKRPSSMVEGPGSGFVLGKGLGCKGVNRSPISCSWFPNLDRPIVITLSPLTRSDLKQQREHRTKCLKIRGSPGSHMNRWTGGEKPTKALYGRKRKSRSRCAIRTSRWPKGRGQD